MKHSYACLITVLGFFRQIQYYFYCFLLFLFQESASDYAHSYYYHKYMLHISS